jgi:6-phosphofructokinase 1
LIPENPLPVADVAKAIEEAYRRGKTHAIIVVAEGYVPHTADLGVMIDAMDIGFTTRVTILGHVQRGGKPTAFERMLATRFGVKSVEFLMAGLTNVMTGLNGSEITPVPIDEVLSHTKWISEDTLRMASVLAR